MPDTPTDYYYYRDKADLTREEVKFYEQTSGSTGNKKSIPYTKGLLKSFENMFLLWVHDLVFHSNLELKSGTFFMSVSPKIGSNNNNDDRKYLSGLTNFLVSPFLASHPDRHQAATGEEFLNKIADDLGNSRDLEVISIWSPTYLLSLLEFMNISGKDYKEIWPELKLISCWTHAQAQRSATKLKEIFPSVNIQPKGLLLTEAPVTIPWTEAGGNVALVTETYLEFLDGEKICKLHEIEQGKEYVVLTSQMNGYLRYNTNDRVKVKGFYFKTPILDFVGRKGQFVDLAGEKISEPMLQEMFKDIKSDCLVIPDLRDDIPSYVILTDNTQQNWDELLKKNYHYDLCRKLGQLKPPKIILGKRIAQTYLEFCQSEGMTLGDIKERILISNLDQAERLLAWIDKEFQSSH